MVKIEGVYTALITPFKNDGTLHIKSLKELCKIQLKNKVDGIVLLGTTGEAPTLSLDEKEAVIRVVVETLKKQLPVFVGVGTNDTQASVDLAKKTATWGVDGLMVVTPYYNKPTQEGIYKHYETVAKASSLPIMIYNNPGRSAQNITSQTLKRITALPNIVSLKESPVNFSQVNDIIQEGLTTLENFTLMSGDDLYTLPMMSLGAKGVVSVASNLIPGTIKEFVDVIARGNFLQAKIMHHELLPLFSSLFVETNPTPLKYAMNQLGLEAGPCRLPLVPLEEKSKSIIDLLLSKIAQ